MSNNKYKILVCEDDEGISGAIKAIFESNGYQVITAYTCRDAEIMFVSHIPDIVILDLGLHHGEGIVLIKRRTR